jgi:hypothetical protein
MDSKKSDPAKSLTGVFINREHLAKVNNPERHPVRLGKSLGAARLSGQNWLERQAGRGLLKKATLTRLILHNAQFGQSNGCVCGWV